MKVDLDKCKGCTACADVCPVGVVAMQEKKARIGEGCVECKTCVKVCPHGALVLEGEPR